MLNDKLIEEVSDVAATVARQIHSRYAVYFDAADVRQELIMWALKRPGKIKEWLDVEDSHDHKAGIRQLAKSMQREADKYCRDRKARAVGYEPRDEAFYSTGMLEELIATMDEVNEQAVSNQVRVSGGGSDPATAGNFLVSVIDVRAAMDKLEPNDQLMLEMRYKEGLTLGQIAEAIGLSDTTVHRRINSSLRKMVDFLGGESPYTYGHRRVVSNSQAKAMLE